VTLPRRRNQTPAVLVFALLAGLLAMHGLSGTAQAAATPHYLPAAVMAMDMSAEHAVHGQSPAAPAPNTPHHGPYATGHQPCLAALAAGVVLDAPAEATNAAGLLSQRVAAAAAPARAPADRSSPDLNELCISRT